MSDADNQPSNEPEQPPTLTGASMERLQELLGISPENAATPEDGKGRDCPHWQHAYKLWQHGQASDARDACLECISLDFANAEAWGLLSQVYAEMDEVEHAAEAARQAVRSEPNNPEWRIMLAAQAQAEGKPDEAERALDRAVELAPKFGRAWFARAALRAERGRADDALADFTIAVRTEPGLYDWAAHVEALDALREHDAFPAEPPELAEQGPADGPVGGENNPFMGL